jgi:hypothetical protein
MYEETAAPVPMCKFAPAWTPLLVDDERHALKPVDGTASKRMAGEAYI